MSTKDILDLAPGRLEDFETEVPKKPMEPLRWSIEKYQVAQLLALSRMTAKQVSEETGVPLHIINRWKKHPEFSTYMNQLTLQMAETLKAKRLQVMSKVLDARLEKVEAAGDYSLLTNKDTLDLLSEMRKETQDDAPKETSRWMDNLEKLLRRSQEREITLEQGE